MADAYVSSLLKIYQIFLWTIWVIKDKVIALLIEKFL